MSVDPRTPCVIGVAQRTIRDAASPEPLDLWEDVCRRAVEDASASGDVLAAVDSLSVMLCESWRYDDPPQRLADRLAIAPRHRRYGQRGGIGPLHLVQDAAEAIVRGDLDVAVVCSGEALATVKAFRGGQSTLAGTAGDRIAHGHGLPWSFPSSVTEAYVPNLHPEERASGLAGSGAPFVLASFDIARRARLGVSPDDYRMQLGELLAGMTTRAAANPYAWFPETQTAEHLITPRPDNRWISYPYTKLMCSMWDVDMAGAAIVTSEAAADRLGVPQDRRVYLHGWCYAQDPSALAERVPSSSSHALAAAGAEAMGLAGIGVDDIEYMDVYSAFTSAVNMARDALGVPDRTGDQMTVTGGNPYNGGPASGYTMHSLATMTSLLREDSGAYGLVHGSGNFLNTHVVTICSTVPPSGAARLPDEAGVQARLDALPVPTIVDRYTGLASVATYCINHHRNGEPSYGVAVVDVGPGARAYARIEDADLLAHAEQVELVGQQVDVVPGDACSFVRATL
jgi:acetyl-CoA C-acetyltransferase